MVGNAIRDHHCQYSYIASYFKASWHAHVALLRNKMFSHRKSNILQTCTTVIGGCLTLQSYQKDYTEAVFINDLCCTWRTQSQC